LATVETTTPMVEAWATLARRHPDRSALTVDDVTVTWRELDLRSNQLARAMARAGAREGDLVSVALPNSVDAVAVVLGIIKLGATPQYVSHRLPPLELDAVLDVARPRLLMASGIETNACVDLLDPGAVPHDADHAPLPYVVSAVMKAPTSGGSTGRPKVILSGGPAIVDRSPDHPMRRLGFPVDEVVWTGSPLYHNLALVVLLSGLGLGNHVVLTAKFDAARSLEDLSRHAVTFALIVPTMMGRILRLPEDLRAAADLSPLRRLVHAAGPCPPWVKHGWIEWLGPDRVLENYGTTEQVALAVADGHEWLARPGTVGRAILGRFEVRGADGETLPAGEVGLIHMRRDGDEVAYRYLGVQEHDTGDRWHCFGDLGRMDADGYLYISDRRTDLIVSGGANIYPAEVEGQLLAHPQVLDCVVVGLPDEDLGRIAHAVVLHGDDRPAEQELRAFMRRRLALYKNPRAYEFTTTPFRDESGKVRRGQMAGERAGRDGLEKSTSVHPN
jgi:bile acid-coenzyme A ligase